MSIIGKHFLSHTQINYGMTLHMMLDPRRLAKLLNCVPSIVLSCIQVMEASLLCSYLPSHHPPPHPPVQVWCVTQPIHLSDFAHCTRSAVICSNMEQLMMMLTDPSLLEILGYQVVLIYQFREVGVATTSM